MDKKFVKVYLYTRYERFWHWIQALLISILLLTGFEIHGTYKLFGFNTAVEIHSFVGLTWLIMFFFFVFWLFTTGEWKQYVPTTKKLLAVVKYYSWGIFKGEPHPVSKTPGTKHNPLQRLTYLSLSAILLPIMMCSGFLYYLYNYFSFNLGILAAIHTLFALFVLNFLIVHVYMTTTGHSIFSHITGMITGWEEVYETTKIEDWEKAERK